MRPEALDAFATQTMRPSALEAATTRHPNEATDQVDRSSSENEHPRILERAPATPAKPSTPNHPSTPAKPSTPFGQRTDGTQSAAHIVEEIAHGVKVAVDGAIAWAEQKVDDLSKEADSTGPYTSPATCMPADLDCIASGILPAMPAEKGEEGEEKEKEGGGKEGEEGEKKEEEGGKRNGECALGEGKR